MSKLTLYDFRCNTCNRKFEEMVNPSIHSVNCTYCGGASKRLVSTPTIKLPGTDPGFPGAYDKWEKTQRQKRQIEKRHYDRHGIDLTFGGDTTP